MIKFKFSNYFLIVKTICFLLIFNSSNVFGEKNKNFENAIINALENSSKIKSAKYLYESKKKLVRPRDPKRSRARISCTVRQHFKNHCFSLCSVVAVPGSAA